MNEPRNLELPAAVQLLATPPILGQYVRTAKITSYVLPREVMAESWFTNAASASSVSGEAMFCARSQLAQGSSTMADTGAHVPPPATLLVQPQQPGGSQAGGWASLQ